MSEPEERAPPAQDETESEGAEDIFGDRDPDGVDPVTVLSTATGDKQEEHASGTATGPFK